MRHAHYEIYAPPGAGKSYLLASFAHLGPLLVFCSDAYGKDTPYREVMTGEPTQTTTPEGIQVLEGTSAEGHLVRVEYLHETGLVRGEPKTFTLDGKKVLRETITGWRVIPYLRKRIPALLSQEQAKWACVGIDSGTSLELMGRKFDQFVSNPDAKDGRQWFGGSADFLEGLLVMDLAGWRNSIVVLAHTDEERASEEAGGGILRYRPKFPGRIAGEMASFYTEIYHAYTEVQAGKTVYKLQTKPSQHYYAASQALHTPDGIANDFREVLKDRS